MSRVSIAWPQARWQDVFPCIQTENVSEDCFPSRRFFSLRVISLTAGVRGSDGPLINWTSTSLQRPPVCLHTPRSTESLSGWVFSAYYGLYCDIFLLQEKCIPQPPERLVAGGFQKVCYGPEAATNVFQLLKESAWDFLLLRLTSSALQTVSRIACFHRYADSLRVCFENK